MSRARQGDLDGVAVSFDFDGVLARSPFGHGVLFPVLRELAAAAAAREGAGHEEMERRAREIAWSEFRDRTATGRYVEAYDWQSIVEHVAQRLGDRFERSLAEMTERYAASLARSGDRSPAFPGARELLARLKDRGACLLLLTNGFRVFQLPVTRALGLEPYLEAIYAADDLGAVKPFREAFERAFSACAGAGARSRARIHVGDTLTHDVLGARASDVRSIWIDWDLPDGLRRLGLRERAGAPELEAVLRGKLEREAGVHGVAGLAMPTVEEVRPDAVVVSLDEVEAAVEALLPA